MVVIDSAWRRSTCLLACLYAHDTYPAIGMHTNTDINSSYMTAAGLHSCTFGIRVLYGCDMMNA